MSGIFRRKPKFDDPHTHERLVKFQESLAHQLKSGGATAVAELETRFNAHDSDGSGSLSKNEYIKAMKEFGKASHLVDEESGKKFSSKDWKLIFLFMDDGEKMQGPDGKDLPSEIECVLLARRQPPSTRRPRSARRCRARARSLLSLLPTTPPR